MDDGFVVVVVVVATGGGVGGVFLAGNTFFFAVFVFVFVFVFFVGAFGGRPRFFFGGASAASRGGEDFDVDGGRPRFLFTAVSLSTTSGVRDRVLRRVGAGAGGFSVGGAGDGFLLFF